MNADKISNNAKLISYINQYLLSDSLGDELEVRFGTNWRNPITQIEFNSVIQKFKSLGFNMKSIQGDYHLNIQCNDQKHCWRLNFVSMHVHCLD